MNESEYIVPYCRKALFQHILISQRPMNIGTMFKTDSRNYLMMMQWTTLITYDGAPSFL
jgi:hypothetical protein